MIHPTIHLWLTTAEPIDITKGEKMRRGKILVGILFLIAGVIAVMNIFALARGVEVVPTGFVGPVGSLLGGIACCFFGGSILSRIN